MVFAQSPFETFPGILQRETTSSNSSWVIAPGKSTGSATMAIDVCYSEISSAGISPRISFSHDLNQTDDVSIEDHHVRLDSSLLDSSSDFDFCICTNFAQEVSSADELFSNGKILPVEIKKRVVDTVNHVNNQPQYARSQTQQTTTTTTRRSTTASAITSAENTEKKRLKEFLLMSLDDDEKPSSKSFWQFKRSSSLNCDSTPSKSLIRSLQFLSRSNSTGSAPNPKPTVPSKENHTQKQHLQKQPSISRKSSTGGHYTYNSMQKPHLKKNIGSYGNGGVRVSPVLNFPPPPFISNATVSFFGFSSLFCNGKFKKKKR